MDMLTFEWDENKNAINKVKHRVSFEEAETVFYDENAVMIPDPEHSEYEERFILLGFSAMARLLLVCHCYRSRDNVIRIISARKANAREARQYDELEV
ncbi:MAG: BrnT family toxin [Clostridia bacterium]|nr:BrnT family toxin [Clostridia bacterium]